MMVLHMEHHRKKFSQREDLNREHTKSDSQEQVQTRVSILTS